MKYPPQEKFMRAVHPDPVEATGYPYGAMIVAKFPKNHGGDWGLFHRASGFVVYSFATRREAWANAKKCGNWPIWNKIKRTGPRSNEVKYPLRLMSRVGAVLRTHGIIPPQRKVEA